MPLKSAIDSFKSIPNYPMVVTDPKGSAQWVNPAFEEMTGYPSSKFLGKKVGHILQGKASNPEVIQKMRDCIKNQVGFSVKIINYRLDETPYLCSIDANPIYEDGVLIGFVAIELDMTESNKNNDLLKKMSTSAKIGAWELDLKTMTPIWSEEIYAIHEIDPKVKVGLEQAINYYSPEHRTLLQNAVDRAIATGQGYDLELDLITAKGHRRRVRTTAHVERIGDVPCQLYGIFQDITDYHTIVTEKALSSKKLRMVSEYSKFGVWEWDVQKDELKWDEVMYSLYKVNRSEFSGCYEGWLARLHPEDVERAKHEVLNAIESEVEYVSHIRIIWPDGQVRHIQARAQIYRDDAGKAIRMLGSNWDVTEQKEKEGLLKQSLAEAKSGIEAKARFLAMMSHEIRTPLNGMMGSLELFDDEGNLNEEQKELLTVLKTASSGLLNTVNEILDFSKMESGKFEITPSDFNLHELCFEIVGAHKALVEKKGIEFQFVDPATLPMYIHSDKNRIRQVLNNLLNNARKFTESGFIKFDVTINDQSDNLISFTFTITDSGIGIPDNQIETVFQEFSQVDASLTRRYEGTGLGLCISKGIAESLNGTLTCESQFEQGSSFAFSLTVPCGAQAEERQGIDKIEVVDFFQHIKVLMAEDNAVNARIIEKSLAKVGIREIVVAQDGQEAVVETLNKKFDLILMDIQMPVMDGEEATKAIRSNAENPNHSTIIMAVTANAMQSDRAKYLEAGFDEVVHKPMSLSSLKDAILKYVKES